MVVKGRHSRGQFRKSSLSTLLFAMLIVFSFLILILLALGILSISTNSGNSPKAHDLSSIVQNTADRSDGIDRIGEQWPEVISWEPRAVVYHNFLSEDECEHLINLAKPHMRKSTVVDIETGKGIDSRDRTSSGTFLGRGSDIIIRNIEKRIADFTFLPSMEKDFKFSTMKWVKNTRLTLTTFLMSLTLRMGVNASLQFLCTSQMLKKGVRQYSLMQKGILVLCLGGTSYLNVESEDCLLNQGWVMRCFSGA